jgi:hypothetical protein
MLDVRMEVVAAGRLPVTANRSRPIVTAVLGNRSESIRVTVVVGLSRVVTSVKSLGLSRGKAKGGLVLLGTV